MKREITRGISFPFRFGPQGRVSTSKADYNDPTKLDENIKQIVLTFFGERPIETQFGSRVREIVFNGYTPALDNIIEEYIQDAVEQWEPRVQINSVEVQHEEPEGLLYIIIEREIVETQQTKMVELEVGGVKLG